MEQAKLDLLVIEAQSGNHKAFDCLIAFFHPQLVKFALNVCGNEALAKDAVQDAWINICDKLKSLNDPRAFRSWIFRAVRWRMFDMLKAKSYQHQSLNPDIEHESITVNLNEADTERRQLSQLINQLPETERDVIYLFYLVDCSLVEIASILEIPVGTVKSRLNRARISLQQQVD